MNLRGMIADVTSRFRESLEDLAEQFSSEGLTPESFRDFVQGLKKTVNEAGLEALVRTILGFEESGELIAHDGRKHRFKEVLTKEWLTPFGVAEVPRRYYQPDAGGKGVAPLDVRCGMQGRYATPDVEEMAAFAAAMLVPREVETLLGKVLPHGPSATAIQRIIEDVGSFAEEATEAIEIAIQEKAPLSSEGDMIAVSWDGGLVPMREEGKKRGRPSERPGVGDSDESPTAYREAGVATISIYGRPQKGEEEPHRYDTRYFARMPEPGMVTLVERQESVVAELLESREVRKLVVVCDGKRSIWNAARNMPTYARATFVLDFYHAAEHLSKAAEGIFGKSEEAAKKWYQKYRARMLEEFGGTEAAIRSMRYHLKKLRKGSERYRTVRRVICFFSRNLDKMDYAGFQAQLLPIGSGPVEAACKTVLTARLKRSGMRWSKEGGQKVMNLRVQVLSKRWDVFWDVYLESRAA